MYQVDADDLLLRQDDERAGRAAVVDDDEVDHLRRQVEHSVLEKVTRELIGHSEKKLRLPLEKLSSKNDASNGLTQLLGLELGQSLYFAD